MPMDMCVTSARERERERRGRERTEKKVVVLGVGPSEKFLTVN